MVNKFKIIVTCIILGSCTVGPDFVPPETKTPPSFDRDADAINTQDKIEDKPFDPKWWSPLNDPELDRLVERLSKENLDLQTATSRIQQSRAQLGIAEADFYPQINGNAQYTREKESDKGAISLLGGTGASGTTGGAAAGGMMGASDIPSTTKIPPFSIYQYGFDASWEIDLWGRVRRSVEAADASLEASEDARRDSQRSLTAELVSDYLQLRGTQESIKVTKENLEVTKELAHLNDERAKGGLGNELDVSNAKAQDQTTQAQLPQFEQQQKQLMNAIALLLSQPPGALESELIIPQKLPLIPPKVPIGIPSDLIKRRPDIRESEAQLHSATAEIGVAKADFFPRVTLMGDGELQSLHFNTLNDWAAHSYTFGPSVSLPIFEGGRLVSTLKLRNDQQKEAALTYQKTVLTAFHEVDNALTAFQKEQIRYNNLNSAADHNKEAVKFAQERYDNGISTYLDVLTAEQNLQTTELQAINSKQTISINMVQLYKALGGGWEADYPLKNKDKM